MCVKNVLEKINSGRDRMKKIISSMLLCAMMLNGSSVLTFAEDRISSSDSTNEIITSETTETTLNSTSLSTEESSTNESSEQSAEKQEMESSTSETVEEDPDASEIVTEETNHRKGEFAMNEGISTRMARIDPDRVYANDSNLPGKNFIDVSSHNGTITVDEYRKIKSYGVTSVAVKLTEGTNYINDFAGGQIQNARAAGLKVSAYHFSRYKSEQGARNEAVYFANAARSFGLGMDTIMINDVEHVDLIENNRNAHANSVAFNKQLKALGYTNDALYVGKSWITAGHINTSAFDRNRVWVAQYPYTPTAGMAWNNDHGAWQWSSDMHFPGISNYENRRFDISVGYSSFFGFNALDLSKYYTENPGRVILKTDELFYNDIDFANPGFFVKKNTLVTVTGVEYTSSGIPRLITNKGYLTANKTYVVAAKNNIDNYYTTNPKKIQMKQNDYYYSDVNFTSKVKPVLKDDIVTIVGLEYTNDGIYRLQTPDGYLTANKQYSEVYVSMEDKYYMTNPNQIVMLTEDTFYEDINFKIPGASVPAGTVVKVTGVEFTAGGVPRLKTSRGYLTANKNYVLAVVLTIDNYYTINPNKILVKNDDVYYRDIDFKVPGTSVAANTLVDVLAVEFTEGGMPRLVTPQGYLTANRSYVTKVVDNVADYYYVNPKMVVMKSNDYFYNDVEFSQKGPAVAKDTLLAVEAVDFSNSGVPRLKTAQGYVTANKKYITPLVNNSEKYYTENPNKVKLVTDDFYYLNVEFSQKGKALKKGTIVDVLGIEYTNTGLPRLKTENGYLTANKSYVTPAMVSNDRYYITNPKKVVALKDDYYYLDLNFTQKDEPFERNTVIDVLGIEYTSSGLPRLKTKNGYLTANKSYVVAQVSNISNYYTENPLKVKLVTDDYYYLDVAFGKKGNILKKDTILTVQGIEYSNYGVPRLKIAQGYITANKNYVIAVK